MIRKISRSGPSPGSSHDRKGRLGTYLDSSARHNSEHRMLPNPTPVNSSPPPLLTLRVWHSDSPLLVAAQSPSRGRDGGEPTVLGYDAIVEYSFGHRAYLRSARKCREVRVFVAKQDRRAKAEWEVKSKVASVLDVNPPGPHISKPNTGAISNTPDATARAANGRSNCYLMPRHRNTTLANLNLDWYC